MNMTRTRARWLVFAGVFVMALALGCRRQPPPQTVLDSEPPRMLSAFFGLDHALPPESRALCLSAPGTDGMPVTFTRRVAGSIHPSVFTVRTRSGRVLHPTCATTKPADAIAERHTVLLIGELGSEPDDPPVAVEVTGSLKLDGGADARGLSGPVTPLADGPTLQLALGAAPSSLASDCPADTRQIVVVVWAGGVHPRPGADQAAHRSGYSVDTAAGEVQPIALGDLSDRDNYVHLCLATATPATRVRFRAGILADPRGDLNPDTSVAVSAPR